MDTTFPFLGLTIHAYGLCAAVAALIVLAGMSRSLSAKTAGLFTSLGIVLGILGARLLYCVCNLSTFTETFENPWLMLRFFDGGLSMPGLIAGLLAAAAITAKAESISFARLMDVLALPLGLAIAALRFGEQFTDLGVGKAVTEGFATAHFPWLFQVSRMGVAMEYRLHVWAYEAIAAVILFAATLLARRSLKKREGHTALFFFALYGSTQILLESMRDDGHMLLIFLRVGQLGAALMPIIACGILAKRVCLRRKVVAWLTVLLCTIGVVLLEFSLDGRLTIGQPTLLRDYSLMALICAALFANVCSLLFTRSEKA